MARTLRPIRRHRQWDSSECCRARTDNAGALDECGSWLVFPEGRTAPPILCRDCAVYSTHGLTTFTAGSAVNPLLRENFFAIAQVVTIQRHRHTNLSLIRSRQEDIALVSFTCADSKM